MGVMNIKGRERVLCNKFDAWHRLHSYHYKELIIKCEILKLRKENENISCNMAIGKVSRTKSNKKECENKTDVVLSYQRETKV